MRDLPAFYMNLDARTDRRAFMEDQFAAIGLAARRVSATPAGAVSQEHLERHCDPAAIHYRTRSELACWYSHLQCWREILATGAPWGLVFEDDAVFSPRLSAFLDAFFEARFDAQCDLLQLETVGARTRVLPPIGKVADSIGLRPFRSSITGSAGYMIRASTLPVLLADERLFEQPVDHRLFCPYRPAMPGWRILLVDPAMCIQADKLDSSGIAHGNVVKFTRFPDAPAHIMRARKRLRRRDGYANFLDHLLHLPKGLRYRVIPFDSADRQTISRRAPLPVTEITD